MQSVTAAPVDPSGFAQALKQATGTIRQLPDAERIQILKQAAKLAAIKLAWYDPDAKTPEEARQRLLALSRNIHTFTSTVWTPVERDVIRLDPDWFTGGVAYGSKPAFDQLQTHAGQETYAIVVVDARLVQVDPSIVLEAQSYLEQVAGYHMGRDQGARTARAMTSLQAHGGTTDHACPPAARPLIGGDLSEDSG